MELYSVRISVEGLDPLDGTTPLGAGIVVQKGADELGIIEATVPVGTLFGVFDPGQLTDLENKTFLVVSAVVTNSVGAHVLGSVVSLRSPDGLGAAPAKDRVALDLALPPAQGIFPITRIVVPIDHKLAFDTSADGAAPGPHTIQLTLVGLDDDEALAVASGTGFVPNPPPTATATTFVFRPGAVGTLPPNVYTDWATLIADHVQVEGPTTIELDNRFAAITIPVGGPYDMRDTLIQGRLLSGVPVPVTITDGATFTNLERLSWVRFDYASASPAMVVPAGLSYFRMWGGSIQNTGAAPFFDVTTPGALLLSQFENASGFNPFPGGTPVVELAVGNFFSFSLDEACSNGVDTVTGPVGSTITAAIRDPGATLEFIGAPTFLGTALTTFLGRASVLVYRPGEPSPAGNVFASWAALAQQLAVGPEGSKVVQIDDSLVSPAPLDADADLTDVKLVGALRGAATFAEIAAGITLTGLTQISDTLTLSSVGPAAPITLAPGEVMVLSQGAALSGAGGGPVVEVVAAPPGVPPAIRFLHGAGTSGPGIAVAVGAGAFMVTQWGAGTSNASGSISGVATSAAAGVILDTSTAFVDPSGDAVWLGAAWIIVLLEKPGLMSYVPGTPADWAVPVPTNQQDVDDRLASAVNGLLDGSIAPGSVAGGIP